jgi:hypothetical protein
MEISQIKEILVQISKTLIEMSVETKYLTTFALSQRITSQPDTKFQPELT